MTESLKNIEVMKNAKSLDILFIEDSEDDAFLVQRELRRRGLNIRSKRVDSIPDMRSALENHSWDVIISDFNLPGFDGFRVLSVYKSFNLETPFFLISGAVGEEIAVDAMKAGAHDYIKKDNLARLVPAIERELREVEIRREQKKVKKLLNVTEARYRTLVNNVPIGVYRCKPGLPGKIIMANPAFCEMLGIDASEIQGKTMADFLVNPKDQIQFSDQLVRLGRVINKEYQFKHRDGSQIWGMVTGQVGHGSQTSEFYFDCTIEDITTRRKDRRLREAIYQIAEASNTTQTLDDLIAQIHAIINSLMNARNFFLALLDEENDLITFPYLIDEIDDDSTSIPFGNGLTSLIIKTGESFLFTPEDYKRMIQSKEVNPVGATPVDWLGVPLRNRDNKTIGAIVVQTYNERSRYSEDDRAILMFISSQIAIAIERRQSEQHIHDQRALLRQVIDINPNFIFAKNKEGQFILANQAVAQAYGTTVDELLGKTEADFNPNETEVKRFRQDDLEVITTGLEKIIDEETFTDASGNIRQLQTTKLPLVIPGQKDTQVLGVSTDITYTFQDALTNLPNQRVFLDRLGRTLRRTKRHGGAYSAVLMIDLDRFAMVNESFGHAIGDELLIQVSERLVKCMRNIDTVSRHGGDEFAILVEDLESVNSINQIAERILDEISVPFLLHNQQVAVTTSIGIALCSPEYTPENVLRDADVALHRAKASGKARYEFFRETMRSSVREKLQLETDLRQAIQKDELVLVFEPIINLNSGNIVSLEALLRWRNPNRGLVSPADFIPLAEETGLILNIGDWVLNRSCELLKRWRKTIPNMSQMAISVNVSTLQIFEGDILQKINTALKNAGLGPHCLQIEITESVIIQNEIKAIEILASLKEMGIKVHLDDFGTGYSSLRYLHNLPLASIKIDRSFVNSAGERPGGKEIVHTIVNLAEGLRLETIAEGVETMDQLRIMKNLNCKSVQGFLFTKPMSVDQTEQFLRKTSGHIDWLA